MDLQRKLEILSSAAKYDVSCSSSGSNRKNKKGGIGNASVSGICHSFTPDGRCVSLLKILMSNVCIYDCSYCISRTSNDFPRATFTPDEICDITINFYKRNYIEGLFLSSAIVKSADFTMEKLYETVYKLRNEHNFNGYIHLKAIPGADQNLIDKAGLLVDRMSVNIELPSSESLKILAPDKDKNKILLPMKNISNKIIQNKNEIKRFKNAPSFVPGGQSTQLIVGASPESDLKILTLSESLYEKMNLKRVYYSAFVPVTNDKRLPEIKNPPTLREHRLYQADWLLRFYGFNANELLSEENPNFDINFDPKTNWALKNIHIFPLEINKAPREMLLRIPGIGEKSVQRIIAIRKVSNITFEDLKKIGVVLKRAQYFLTCNGKYYGDVSFDEPLIRDKLAPKEDLNILESKGEQLNFFNMPGFSYSPAILKVDDIFSSVIGEL
ncbi:MAG TPA: putative DNA modification/repair radical SAM protein [Terrisporobacter glycolicus]|uniref:putative DNA modification/repair radical SAM protein n=1 Tax=Terrisporobacter TaxID=1505652 RepID=UPI0008E6D34E|nr:MULTISPECIES: putative DNA modification/repair radical SAM protein [Terrisporobacter]SFJ19432.1 putative DNA modification/repair radical SAM protein [Terrisporobacter glycolicus]HBI91779.1 putative DNA modification/repair radical SAM protein [Terrisporobacter hibernicus]